MLSSSHQKPHTESERNLIALTHARKFYHLLCNPFKEQPQPTRIAMWKGEKWIVHTARRKQKQQKCGGESCLVSRRTYLLWLSKISLVHGSRLEFVQLQSCIFATRRLVAFIVRWWRHSPLPPPTFNVSSSSQHSFCHHDVDLSLNNEANFPTFFFLHLSRSAQRLSSKIQ